MAKKSKSIYEDGGKENEQISEQGYQKLLDRINPVSEVGQWATKKIQHTLAHNPELTPLYIGAELPVSGLLEDKTRIPEVFLDVIGLRADIQDRLREIQYHEPKSITQCNFFLSYMIERTAMKNLVEGLIPQVLLSKEDEQDIASKIMVGKRPIDIRVYTEMIDDIRDSSHMDYIFGPHMEGYISGSTLTPEDKRNRTIQHYYDEMIIWDKEMNIVGIFVLNKTQSLGKLCQRLMDEGYKYPEAWKYLTYLLQYPDKIISNNH